MKKTLFRFFFSSLSKAGFAPLDKTRHITRHFKPRDTTTGYPFISGDVFRAFSHHIVDATGTPFFPEHVKERDVVFIKTKYLKKFIKYMHPYIKYPYVLITHNGDEEAPGTYIDLLEDEKIIRWFGLNATLAHPKLIPLPIGHGNPGNNATFENLIQELHQHPLPKENLLYLNIGVTTHPDRPAIKKYFSTQPFCKVEDPKAPSEYMKEVMRSKFHISPRGNGIDCNRVWESLLVGSIPVLKTTLLDPLYRDLPILIVNDWTEVTEEFLRQKYEEMSKKEYNFEKCYVDYWLNLIKPYTHTSHISQLWESSRVKMKPHAAVELRHLFWPQK